MKNDKNTILMITTGLERGGKEKQLYTLVNNLGDLYQIVLVILDEKIDYPLDAKKICVICIKKSDWFKTKSFMIFLHLIKRYRPIVVHYWDLRSSIYALVAKFYTGSLMIDGTIRGAAPLKLGIACSLLRRFSFRFAQLIIANSIAGLSKEGLAHNQKARVIYNGIDIECCNQPPCPECLLSINSNTIKIVMVAGFKTSKDHRTLILASNDLLMKRKNVYVVLIGDGNTMSVSKSLINSATQERMLFIGETLEVESYLKHCDIGVLLTNTRTNSEGISNSIMEYMAASLPVIATNAGGTPELVQDEISGFLIEPYNAVQLLDKLDYLIDNEVVRREMGLAGKRIIEENFSTSVMMDGYIELYRSLGCR